jgi:hypothetical protein
MFEAKVATCQGPMILFSRTKKNQKCILEHRMFLDRDCFIRALNGHSLEPPLKEKSIEIDNTKL